MGDFLLLVHFPRELELATRKDADRLVLLMLYLLLEEAALAER